MNNKPIFLPAISVIPIKETGELLYVPGIYSTIVNAIIWCSNSGFTVEQAAIELANLTAEFLEEDFHNYLETGIKNVEFVEKMMRSGVFFEPSNSPPVKPQVESQADLN